MIRKNEITISNGACRMIEEAASRAGMSVGEWLDEVIVEAAANEGVKDLRSVFEVQEEAPRRRDVDFNAIHSRLDEITARIESLAQGASCSERSRNGQRAMNGSERQQSVLDRVSNLLRVPAADRASAGEESQRRPTGR